MLKLNLGCSDDLRPGYLNVDVAPPAELLADLNQRWPWDDSTVDEIYAHDVFEHLSATRRIPVLRSSKYLSAEQMDRMRDIWHDAIRQCKFPALDPGLSIEYVETGYALGKIWAMNEAHRVLKPGGKLDLAVPCVMLSDGRVNPGAFADPTHRTFWTLDDRYFFGEEWNHPQGERGRLGPAYGITALFRGEWKLVEYGIGPERRSKVMAILEAVK